MKLNRIFLPLLALACAIVSCGKPNEEPEPKPATINLKSQSIAEGEELKGGSKTITLEFDKMVKADASISSTLNDSVITPSIDASTVKFKVKLNYSTNYTLSVPAGAFVSVKDATIKSAAVTIHFSTAAKPEKAPFDLGLGWNFGNQLDAQNNGKSSETAWGNPAGTQATFDGVKAAGFTSVRIPVTWMGHFGEAPDYLIEEAWMNRVAEVVGYAHNAGLKAIINIHHDGCANKDEKGNVVDYWLSIRQASTSETANDEIKATLKALWTQIANRFKDEEDWLMFETLNEIQDGGWGWGANRSDGGRQYRVLNEWNQVCVDAIRATGGNNDTRWIGCPGYSTDLDLTVANFVLPTDEAKRVAVAIHYYAPYDFTLECKDNAWGTTAEKAALEAAMKKIYDVYLANGIACYIGEFGCCQRAKDADEHYRLEYLTYFGQTAYKYGISAVLWDNNYGNGGKESNAFINHGTGAYINDKGKVATETLVQAYQD